MAHSLRLANQNEWTAKKLFTQPGVLGAWTQFLPFEEALAVARSLGLPGRREWLVWCKEGMRPPNVPADPVNFYKDGGWQGWGHWLGTGNQSTHTKKFLPFGEALAVARSLGLANQREWYAWCKESARPPNVPSNPSKFYKDGGWQGWVHWLGSGNIKKASKFAPFDQALDFARSLGLAGEKEWRVWCKEGRRPPNVPSHPGTTYKDTGWQGWGHWLHHANLDAHTAPATAPTARKRAAPGGADTPSPGTGRGKRRRALKHGVAPCGRGATAEGNRPVSRSSLVCRLALCIEDLKGCVGILWTQKNSHGNQGTRARARVCVHSTRGLRTNHSRSRHWHPPGGCHCR